MMGEMTVTRTPAVNGTIMERRDLAVGMFVEKVVVVMLMTNRRGKCKIHQFDFPEFCSSVVSRFTVGILVMVRDTG